MPRYVINLPGSTTEHAKKKNSVRQSSEWKELREEVKKSQRTDPLTGASWLTTNQGLQLSSHGYEP